MTISPVLLLTHILSDWTFPNLAKDRNVLNNKWLSTMFRTLLQIFFSYLQSQFVSKITLNTYMCMRKKKRILTIIKLVFFSIYTSNKDQNTSCSFEFNIYWLDFQYTSTLCLTFLNFFLADHTTQCWKRQILTILHENYIKIMHQKD